MSLKVPLLDPDAFLTRLAGNFAWAFTLKGALLWLAVVVPALFLAAQNWEALTANLADRVLSGSNLLVMALVFPLVKALHELGHGFAVKTWGGDVHEMGVMFLVFAPIPYVEASSASAFPSKRRRAAVGAAGMLVEMFLAAVAMYVWLLVEPGLLHAIAYNVMVVAGISTLVVNGNPLLRYDGYYILCDLIEMPNLGQRGPRYLTLLWDRYVFRVRDLEPSPETSAEKRWLVGYTITSWCYRVFITVAIILFIAGEFFIFGVLIALWATASLLLLPVWKAVKHVLHAPHLHQRRQQAVRLSLALTAGAVLLLGVVPAPLRTQAEGVVWLPEQSMLRAGGDGIFLRWMVEPGSRVERGAPVLLMEDPLLAAELEVARAKLMQAAAHYRAEQFESPDRAQIARDKLDQEQRVLARTEERAAQLVVASEAEGVLVVAQPQDMPGQFFRKGELLGYVLEGKEFIVRVVVRQDDIDLARTRFKAARLRLADDIRTVHTATMIREMAGGINELPSPALGPNGGGTVMVDPTDDSGVKTLERVFIFDLKLPPAASPKAFGERVYVRFDHGSEPLFAQGYRRLRQLFLSRFSV
jgi:putative peptide zinc metalloprotease protein